MAFVVVIVQISALFPLVCYIPLKTINHFIVGESGLINLATFRRIIVDHFTVHALFFVCSVLFCFVCLFLAISTIMLVGI